MCWCKGLLLVMLVLFPVTASAQCYWSDPVVRDVRVCEDAEELNAVTFSCEDEIPVMEIDGYRAVLAPLQSVTVLADDYLFTAYADAYGSIRMEGDQVQLFLDSTENPVVFRFVDLDGEMHHFQIDVSPIPCL